MRVATAGWDCVSETEFEPADGRCARITPQGRCWNPAAYDLIYPHGESQACHFHMNQMILVYMVTKCFLPGWSAITEN